MCSYEVGKPDRRRGSAHAATGVPRARGGAPIPGSRSARHPFLRSSRQVGPQPGARSIEDAVSLDGESLSRMQSRLRLLPSGGYTDPHGGRATQSSRRPASTIPPNRWGASSSSPPRPGRRSCPGSPCTCEGKSESSSSAGSGTIAPSWSTATRISTTAVLMRPWRSAGGWRGSSRDPTEHRRTGCVGRRWSAVRWRRRCGPIRSSGYSERRRGVCQGEGITCS
jgi:hypothetical protein